jgi:hypothetical protein
MANTHNSFHHQRNPILYSNPPSHESRKASAHYCAIHTIITIMRNITAWATDVELSALFHNSRDGVPLHTTLPEMGHPPATTPVQTGNACTTSITDETIKQWCSKAIDMHFYWIHDIVKQGQFLIHWQKGTHNLADNFTKHHSPTHHSSMRSMYLLELRNPVPE